MGSLSAIPIVGFLGVLFIIFNVIILILLTLTIIFGIIRFTKRSLKVFAILLVLTILLGIEDYQIINEFVNYDEVQHQNLIKKKEKN